LVAVDAPDQSQPALELVRQVATEGVTRVHVLHLRERELFRQQLVQPRRGELATRLFGSVTMRVLRRSSCPVIVAARRPPERRPPVTSSSAPDHRP
jgi:nucleotide-binding universal stress UspA family protein